MQIFNSYKNIPAEAQGAVVVIGNFDGVHRGHQVLLETGRELAQAKGAKLAVLTFEPHPRALFRPDDPPFRITPAPVKNHRLAIHGVERLFSVPFDWDFASQSAQAFIENVLTKGLKPTHIVVGYDFRFGQLRKGQPSDFEEAGFPVTVVEEVADEGDSPLSSSQVRMLLRHGKIVEANKLLGWDWEIAGKVVHGDKRGRELGYPTANVPLGKTMHPAYGVYASLVQIEGEEQWRPSATNLGIRPMFEVPEAQVETFIFDFDQEIYDKTLRIRLVERLRGEAKFDSLEELIAQIEQDCEMARERLKKS